MKTVAIESSLRTRIGLGFGIYLCARIAHGVTLDRDAKSSAYGLNGEPSNASLLNVASPLRVLGTELTDERELSGDRPLFVDAFYDTKRSKAYVLFNMKTVIGIIPGAKTEEYWAEQTKWECTWHAPANRGKRPEVYTVPGHVNFESSKSDRAHSVDVEVGIQLADDDDDESQSARIANVTDPSLVSARDDKNHWTIIVTCPLDDAPPGLELDVVARREGYELYRRPGIPVSEGAFMKGGIELAMCTMVVSGWMSTPGMVTNWVQYNLAMGVQQILIYVEEQDTKWVEKAAGPGLAQGRVTVVPFFFGRISARRKFEMQGAMENHCLYQAKGRAKWLAHQDVDEYFQLLGDFRTLDFPAWLHLYAPKVGGIAGIISRSARWWSAENHGASRPYPCGLTRRAIKFKAATIRSKVVVNPENVLGLFPHCMKTVAGTDVLVPEPTTEMRTNHYKTCCPGGCLVFDALSRSSKTDHSFVDRCTALLPHATKIKTTTAGTGCTRDMLKIPGAECLERKPSCLE